MVALARAGGDKVRPGTYWSYTDGEMVRFSREGELPGGPASRFLKLPAFLLLLLSPVLGLVFLMFLPVAGIALTIYLPLKAVVGRLRASDPVQEAAPARVDRSES